MIRPMQGFKGLMQGPDGSGVKGVLLGRTIDGDEDDAVGRRVDPHQAVVGVRSQVGHQRMGDGVDFGGLGIGDVQGVEVGVGGGFGHGDLLSYLSL